VPTLDEVMRKVDQLEPDRPKVARLVSEVIAALEMRVDEATGEVVPKPAPYKAPEQHNIRFAGMQSRRGGRR
jgi:hypothetical protein